MFDPTFRTPGDKVLFVVEARNLIKNKLLEGQFAIIAN